MVLEDALFKDKRALGVIFRKWFNPIPLATYALVASVVSISSYVFEE